MQLHISFWTLILAPLHYLFQNYILLTLSIIIFYLLRFIIWLFFWIGTRKSISYTTSFAATNCFQEIIDNTLLLYHSNLEGVVIKLQTNLLINCLKNMVRIFTLPTWKDDHLEVESSRVIAHPKFYLCWRNCQCPTDEEEFHNSLVIPPSYSPTSNQDSIFWHHQTNSSTNTSLPF